MSKINSDNTIVDNRYRLLSVIGHGGQGVVYEAIDMANLSSVAVKHIKFDISKMLAHPLNISISCHQIVREIINLFVLDSQFNNTVTRVHAIMDTSADPSSVVHNIYIVMDKYSMDLLAYLKLQEPFRSSDREISELSLMYHLFCCIKNMHSVDIVHRDLKPSNILINYDTTRSIATSAVINDFGSSRRLMSDDPVDTMQWTDYITTRWYRAPEMCEQLVRGSYSKACDIWSMGCILYECAARKPLFRGTSHLDQLRKITRVLGSPPSNSQVLNKFAPLRHEENEQLHTLMHVEDAYKMHNDVSLSNIIRDTSLWCEEFTKHLTDLLDRIFKWDPSDRADISVILAHPLFEKVRECTKQQTTSKYMSDIMSERLSTCLSILKSYDQLYLTPIKSCQYVHNVSNIIHSFTTNSS